MNNPLIISTAAYDGYDLDVVLGEISETGVDLVEIAFIEGYTAPFTEAYFNDLNAISDGKPLYYEEESCELLFRLNDPYSMEIFEEDCWMISIEKRLFQGISADVNFRLPCSHDIANGIQFVFGIFQWKKR